MKVAVLGCGPTGLIAAHACRRMSSSIEVSIFSKRRKSHLFGSQYLHNPIPGITNVYDKGEHVKYIVRGTPEEYRQKTHGKWWDGQAAPEEFEPDHTAWNIRTAYDTLWQKFGHLVNGYGVEEGLGGFETYRRVHYDLFLDNYDLVINTMPRNIWAIDGEEYTWSEGWVIGDAPEMGVFVNDLINVHASDGEFGIPDNTIVCDGTEDVAWTRASRVYGYTTVEWPHHMVKPPIPGVTKVIKPLSYRASSQNPTSKWLHVGRYGKWQKGVVVTDAWNEVNKRLTEMI